VLRRSVLKGLLDESWPVPKRTGHHAAVDKVESVGERPWLFQIINLELEIWWDTVTGVSYNEAGLNESHDLFRATTNKIG
jgi:hypothetical protein